MQIVTCEQMRKAEQYAVDSGISTLRLMENAGSAAARFIRNLVNVSGVFFAVICGKGNNGGDGFVVARKLMENGANVSVILASGEPATADAAEMLERLRNMPVNLLDYNTRREEVLESVKECSYIVDAVYGTGFHGSVDESYADLFRTVNAGRAIRLALDMPSGANADTGEVSGLCIRADYTITFGAPKTGQFTFPAAEYCGKVNTVNIGIPDYAFLLFENTIELLDMNNIRQWIPARRPDSNKGTYGKLSCFCGSLGMSGAAYLSAAAALRCGAGLITAYVPKDIYPPLAAKFDEVMVFPLEASQTGSIAYGNYETILKICKKSSSVLIGCGLSQNEGTLQLVRELIKQIQCPVILDADGINAFSGHIDLLRESKAELIITPHPGEMARLLQVSVSQVQSARLKTAVKLAEDYGITVVLKGANTIIASPDGKTFINPTGNPGMAKGGSGDILAGMIASFAAQGFSSAEAACCGAYIHGLAGDRCAEKLSQYAMAPSDILLEIPQIFREMSR